MMKTISSQEMRDRLLSRLKETSKKDDWVRVLSAPGNRALLSIIATQKPASIGALAELAGRAQPNVSRALNALVAAELVSVTSEGRRSIPAATDLGLEKLKDVGLANDDLEASTTGVEEPNLFSVSIASDTGESIVDGQHRMLGILTTWLWRSSSRDRCPARTTGDLNLIGRRLSDNWWRILYRRDAPFKLWDFSFDGEDSTYALIVNVAGSSLELSARRSDGYMLDLAYASRKLQVRFFEAALLEEFLQPLISLERMQSISASQLAGRVARIQESRDFPNDAAFCRVAGALGTSPYGIEDGLGTAIQQLIKLVSDEGARLDFASALLADHLIEGEAWIKGELEKFGKQNSLHELRKLREHCSKQISRSFDRPYQRGYALARCAREQLHLANDRPVGGVEGLSRLFGAENGFSLSREAPGSLRAVQSSSEGDPAIFVEDEGDFTSSFVFARAVGDYLEFGSELSCVADLYTDRQAVGRSFAAEFMAPSNAVVEMIEGEDRPITQIAEHFGVSPTVIHHQYQNSAAWH
jgi:DNA-binding transcriptional ArsR family regulator